MINHKHSLSTFCIIFLFSLLYFNLTIAISDVTGPEVSDFVLEENTKTLTKKKKTPGINSDYSKTAG